MKRYSIPLLLSLLSLTGLAVSNVKVLKSVEVHGASLAAKPPVNINLNDLVKDEIREYYADLNSLSEDERKGTNLLKNLKPILKRNHVTFTYDSNPYVWQSYEILDRDWTLSPAKDIPGYDETTNTITNYKYGKSMSDKGSNPYLHALYVNRDAENKTRAWDGHNQVNYEINREHIWPKSAGFDDDSKSGGARGDLMHLWAGNGRVNGAYHNNNYYGYVKPSSGKEYKDAGNDYPYLKGNLIGYSKTLGGSTIVFEPQDQDKGDIARVIFYMAARYNYYSGSDSDGINAENPNLQLANDLTSFESTGYTSTTTRPGFMGILQDLLEWNRLDPPDTFEIHRNNLAYRNFTNNRNPFVDFPDWAEYVWGKCEDGKYDSTPTGSANPQTDEIPGAQDGPVMPKKENKGLDTKTIIIIAVVVAVVIIVAVIIFICLSKKGKKKALKAAKKVVKKEVKKSVKSSSKKNK